MMYYVIGGTIEAADWYIRYELRTVDSRMIRKMSVATIARSGSLRGVRLKKDDEIIEYAWDLGTRSDQITAGEELHMLKQLREL